MSSIAGVLTKNYCLLHMLSFYLFIDNKHKTHIGPEIHTLHSSLSLSLSPSFKFRALQDSKQDIIFISANLIQSLNTHIQILFVSLKREKNSSLLCALGVYVELCFIPCSWLLQLLLPKSLEAKRVIITVTTKLAGKR